MERSTVDIAPRLFPTIEMRAPEPRTRGASLEPSVGPMLHCERRAADEMHDTKRILGRCWYQEKMVVLRERERKVTRAFREPVVEISFPAARRGAVSLP